MAYVAYNKWYKKGKPTGRAFRVSCDNNKEALKKRVMSNNKRWHKTMGGDEKPKLYQIKKVKRKCRR